METTFPKIEMETGFPVHKWKQVFRDGHENRLPDIDMETGFVFRNEDKLCGTFLSKMDMETGFPI